MEHLVGTVREKNKWRKKKNYKNERRRGRTSGEAAEAAIFTRAGLEEEAGAFIEPELRGFM